MNVSLTVSRDGTELIVKDVDTDLWDETTYSRKLC